MEYAAGHLHVHAVCYQRDLHRDPGDSFIAILKWVAAHYSVRDGGCEIEQVELPAAQKHVLRSRKGGPLNAFSSRMPRLPPCSRTVSPFPKGHRANWLVSKLEKFAEMARQMRYRWPGRRDEDDYLIVMEYQPTEENLSRWR